MLGVYEKELAGPRYLIRHLVHDKGDKAYGSYDGGELEPGGQGIPNVGKGRDASVGKLKDGHKWLDGRRRGGNVLYGATVCLY